MTIFLIIHNCAIELIPQEIRKHPTILKASQKRGINPSKMILDRAMHGKAMKNIAFANQRGRPDILHTTFQQITFSALNKQKRLHAYVHLRDNWIFKMPFDWRPPANYSRFIPLFEQLLINGQIPVKGSPLIKLERLSLSALVARLNTPNVYYFTSNAPKRYSLREIGSKIVNSVKPMLLIGGFQTGYIKPNSNWESIALSRNSLPTSIVIAKLLTTIELMLEALEH
ncbi:MAG: hypothetical protein ACFFC7_00500 [Candidatus Hermodarchaeota archaeon]